MRVNTFSGVQVRYFAVFAAVALALWIAIAAALQTAEREAMEKARTDGRNLARSLAEHVAASVRVIDLVLLQLRSEWTNGSPRAFAGKVAEQQKYLKDSVVVQMSVITAAGRIAYSYLPDPGNVDLSDRQYFKVHKEREADELYVSEPFLGRLSKQWIIQFTRAIYDRAQRFAGVLVLTVPPPALERVYKDIELGEGASIVLARHDGQILAHSRDLARAASVSLAEVPELRRNDASGGEARRKAKVDGVERLYHFQKVRGYPLTIIVGQAVDTVLAPYRTQRTTYLVSGALATALLLALTLLLVSRRHQQEEADRDRARREAELRQSEEQMRALFDSFPIAVAHVDKAQRITFANRIYQSDYGADPTGRSVREFVGAEAYAALEPNIERALAGEEVQFERSFVAADGGIGTRALRYIPERDASGAVTGFFALREDVTPRKRYEEDLRRFRAAMDATADAIYLVDRSSMRFIDVNEAACRVHKRTREELFVLGPAGLLATSRAELECAYDAVIADPTGTERFERQRRAADGSLTWVEVQRSAQRSDQGWMIVVVVRDITERKQTEERIRLLNEQLEQRVQERTAELRATIDALQAEVEERQLAEASAMNLAARVQSMARRLGAAQEEERRRLAAELHDGVCSNLAAIGLNAMLLQKQLPLADAAVMARRLSELIALIDEAKANAKDISVDLRPLLLEERDLTSALEEYARKFQDSTGMAIEVGGADCGRRLAAEEKIALFRIAQEALTNCARHAQAKTVAIELNTERDRLDLSISDDGVGMDLAGIGHNGQGFGLLSMQERAAAIGGTWSIDSAPGRGTRVTVSVAARA